MSFVRFVVVICLLLMPSLVSALDVGFYSRSDLNDDVQISPDGTYLSLQVNQDGKQGLAILKTDSMEPINMIRFNQNRYPEAAEWVNPRRSSTWKRRAHSALREEGSPRRSVPWSLLCALTTDADADQSHLRRAAGMRSREKFLFVCRKPADRVVPAARPCVVLAAF